MDEVRIVPLRYVDISAAGSIFIKGMGSETVEGMVGKWEIITEFAIRQLAIDACKRVDYQESS